MISITPETYAKQHMFHRSSPVARMELGSEIVDNFGLGKPVEPELTNKMSARNVQILNAYLLIMGMELEFTKDELVLPNVKGDAYDKDVVYTHKLNGETYVATPDHMLKEYARKQAIERMETNEIGYFYIGEEGVHKEEMIDEVADMIAAEVMEEGEEYFKNRDKIQY